MKKFMALVALVVEAENEEEADTFVGQVMDTPYEQNTVVHNWGFLARGSNWTYPREIDLPEKWGLAEIQTLVASISLPNTRQLHELAQILMSKDNNIDKAIGADILECLK